MSLAPNRVGSWVSEAGPLQWDTQNDQPQRHPQPGNGNLWAQLYTNKSTLVPFS